MMRAHPIKEGMRVRTSDGERLGRVVLTGERTFQIEKGYFFPKEYVARYDDVSGVDDDEIVLAMTREELMRGLSASTAGAAPPTVPESMQATDPAERARLEEQLRLNQERQWAAARPTHTTQSAKPVAGGHTASTSKRHEPIVSQHKAAVEEDHYRVGEDATSSGFTESTARLRHREYAVGYSEARGETIAFESERIANGGKHEHRVIEATGEKEGEEDPRRNTAPDMAGTRRGDPGEHP